MGLYKKILVAVDLNDEAAEVLASAQEVAQEQKAEMYLLTVIRPLTYAYSGYDTPALSQSLANFEPEARAAAMDGLKKLTAKLDLRDDQLLVDLGRPADVIKDVAEKMKVDLVVVGSHGRHGLGLLLGSTANGVLHGSPCDVLTVRIGSD